MSDIYVKHYERAERVKKMVCDEYYRLYPIRSYFKIFDPLYVMINVIASLSFERSENESSSDDPYLKEILSEMRNETHPFDYLFNFDRTAFNTERFTEYIDSFSREKNITVEYSGVYCIFYNICNIAATIDNLREFDVRKYKETLLKECQDAEVKLTKVGLHSRIKTYYNGTIKTLNIPDNANQRYKDEIARVKKENDKAMKELTQELLGENPIMMNTFLRRF